MLLAVDDVEGMEITVEALADKAAAARIVESLRTLAACKRTLRGPGGRERLVVRSASCCRRRSPPQ